MNLLRGWGEQKSFRLYARYSLAYLIFLYVFPSRNFCSETIGGTIGAAFANLFLGHLNFNRSYHIDLISEIKMFAANGGFYFGIFFGVFQVSQRRDTFRSLIPVGMLLVLCPFLIFVPPFTYLALGHIALSTSSSIPYTLIGSYVGWRLKLWKHLRSFF